MHNTHMITETASLPPHFSRLMAQSLSNIGRSTFYESVVELVRQMIPCDFWIIARYETCTSPCIVSENGMRPNAKTIYADTLWQHDPLLEGLANPDPRVVSLSRLRLDGALDNAYARYIDTNLQIEDELALLLPINENSFLALCLDRQTNHFSEAEILLACQLQEMLFQMHQQHILRSVDHQVSLFLHRNGLGRPEVMILRNDSTVLYKSDTWSHAAEQAFSYDPKPESISAGSLAEISGRDGWLLTQLQCVSDDAILGGAHVFLLHKNGVSMAERIEEFGRLHQLTKRQQEIVQLSLRGHHNASIASQLGLSIGSVKNHKLRIYSKLDITSERELVSAILHHHS
ncbi:helix-turn-helix transcriptional regulator [uncultured Cohaesibacter sp.]|uniref:helix-turn-helix transcriptional regulator n=1 Tax=uncultured Cohaesibacter sp. TaxID=1002546 RepID=UPI0029C892A8|nr:helix-turn-helix transcriptional regulator [uncultured Cohaesibacter sp.]